MRRIYLVFLNLKLEGKILILHLLAASAFVALFSIIGIKYITDNNNKMLYSTMATAETLLVAEVEDRMEDITALADMVRSDSQIQNSLDVVKREINVASYSPSIYSALERCVQSHRQRYLNYTLLSNPKFMNSTYGFVKTSMTNGELQTLKAKAKMADGSGLWIPKDNNTLYYIQEIKKIKNLDLDDLGTFIVSINPEKMVEEVSKQGGGIFENSQWIIRQGDKPLYISEGLEQLDINQHFKDGQYAVLIINGERKFVTIGKSPFFSYIHVVPYEEVMATVDNVKINSIVGLVLSMFFMLAIVHIVISKMTVQIDNLIKDMESFTGDASVLKPLDGLLKERNDEVGILHKQFHKMANNVSDLIEQDYKKELLIKDAQLGNLESQMNPHFLYNTLESINWRAKMKGEQEISSIVESLGQFLRISLREKEDSYSLGKEVEVINCYMTIQKLRYEDRLDFVMDIPKEMLDIKVPKLSVQPLVENAIQYALEEMVDICEIKVEARVYDEIYHDATVVEDGQDAENSTISVIEIRVSNTGSEFDDDMLEVLKARRGNKKGLGIALLNIEDRIHLMFGEQYGLKFSNEDDRAVVMVVLPVTRI